MAARAAPPILIAVALASAGLLPLRFVAPQSAEPRSANAPEKSHDPPSPFFVERADTGVDFVHHRYQTPEKKYLPETAGAGVGLLDYDQDGDLDLYFVQEAPLPGYPGKEGPLPDKLYRNDGGWKFTDVTAAAGLGDLNYGMGVTCPDVDNDGFPDLMVTNVGRVVLYRNKRDGSFEDVTKQSGLADDHWSTAAGWADLDDDGDLDLYLANYAFIDFEHYKVCTFKNLVSYCHPDTFTAAPDRLFRNDGGFRFTDVTKGSGIVDPPKGGGKGLAVVPFDHDGDGRLDLYVANDSDPNFLWMNHGRMHFENMADEYGVAVNGRGQSQACMGSDIADVDGDLDFDVFSANFGKESNVLYARQEGDWYEDRSYPSGLGEPSFLFTGFGAQFFDHDRDADLDLMVVNGHIVDIIRELDPTQTFEQVPHLYVNRGNGTFDQAGPSLSPFFTKPNLGRGLAVGDLDVDGDLDAVICENDHAAVLLENAGAGPTTHWIGFQLVGSKSPRDAIGARLLLTCADKKQIAEVRGSTSYLSWVDLRLFFGVGSRTAKPSAHLRWPSGIEQDLENLDLDRYHKIVEPER